MQVFYNNKGYHSMPTFLNVLNNAILRANLPPSKGNPAAYGESDGTWAWPRFIHTAAVLLVGLCSSPDGSVCL